MNSISSCCSAIPGCRDNAVISKSYNAIQFSQIAASSQENKDITIYTNQGDKVTISYDHQTQASYAGLKALSYGGIFAGTENRAVTGETLMRLRGERFQFEDSRNLTITVFGDLNDQELADIKKAIAGIDEIMTDLLQGGDISEAMTDAAELKGLESIAGLEADYRYEKILVTEKYSLKEFESHSKYGLSEDILPGRKEIKLDTYLKILEKMTKIIEDSGARPSRFSRPLKNLFANIDQKLEKNEPENRAKRHLADLIGAEMIKRIGQMAEAEEVKNEWPLTNSE